MFNAGTVRLGQTIFDKVKENMRKHEVEEQAKYDKKKKDYLLLVAAAKKIHELGKEFIDLKSLELHTLLRPLRQQGDSKIPKGKVDRKSLFQRQKDRPFNFDLWNGFPLKVEGPQADDGDEDDDFD